MRCLLISALDPYQKGSRPLLTPLSLAYLAGFLLKNGHEVMILQREVDYIRLKFNLKEVNRKMIKTARHLKPQVVGFSAVSATIGDLLHSSRLLRQVLPEALFICGGPHVSALPEETLRQGPQLDAAVIGDGEETLAEMCDSKNLNKVAGIVYRTGAGLVRTEKRSNTKNLDFLPYPARNLLDMNFHTSVSPAVIPNLSLKTTTIVSARGCPFACSFCTESRQKLGMGWHSPEYVIGEVEDILSRYKVEGLYFIDSMFEFNRKRTEEICRLMIKQQLNKRLVWSIQARASTMDRDLLVLMKEAGCIQIEYGFETGSQRILDLMGKKTTVEAGIKAAQLTRECGIRVYANMIFGYPGETERDFDLNLDFIKRIKPDALGAYLLEAFPGTALYEELAAEGKLKLHFEKPGCDWSETEVQRENRNMNFSSIPDHVFSRKMKEFRQEVVGPLNTADLLKNLRGKAFKADILKKIPILLTQPRRVWKVGAKLIRGK